MPRPRPRVAPFWLATPILIVLLLSTGPPDRAASQTDSYQLLSSVFSGGGNPAWGGGHWSVGSLGQPSPIGISTGRTTLLHSGFWSPSQRATDTPDLPRLTTRLQQNAPNPFNPATRIDYQLAHEEFVSVEVFNLQGRRIQVLVRERQKAGEHHVMWYGRDEFGGEVASGVYFYRLQVGQFRDVKRMLLLK